jgi:hypothetical protein
MKKLVIIWFMITSLKILASCEETPSQFTITDPAFGDEFTVKLTTYSPAKSPSYVFIFPAIVGESVIDKRIASRFCSQNIHAIIVNAVREIPFELEIKDLSIHDHSYLRASLSLVPLIKKIRNSNPQAKLGVMGTSLGGMLAAYVAGTNPEIIASVIVVGAGNVAGVLAHSNQELVIKQRNERMNHFNLKSVEEYELLLKRAVYHDPLVYAQGMPPKSSYLFIATSDATVPTKYQQELRRNIREPLVYEMAGDHVNGIIKAGTVHLKKIVNFMRLRLN